MLSSFSQSGLWKVSRWVCDRGEIDGLGVVENRILDENRRARPERQGDRVARPGINRHGVPVEGEVDERVSKTCSPAEWATLNLQPAPARSAVR